MQAAARSDWDLAQFDFAPRSRSARQLQAAWDGLWQLPTLRPLRWSLLALLLVNLGGLQWSAWQAQTAMQTQRAAIAQVLTQTFPQVQVVVDAPLQMERQVQTLLAHSGAVSAHDFEAMAKALGAVLPPDTVPAALDFAPGELRAAGLAPDPQMLATARAALSSQGYSVEQAGDTLVIRLRSTP
jgi:general secretion pathway protein L